MGTLGLVLHARHSISFHPIEQANMWWMTQHLSGQPHAVVRPAIPYTLPAYNNCTGERKVGDSTPDKQAAVSTVLCLLCEVVCTCTPLIYVKRQCSYVCVQGIQL